MVITHRKYRRVKRTRRRRLTRRAKKMVGGKPGLDDKTISTMLSTFNVCKYVNYGRVKPTYVGINDLKEGAIYQIPDKHNETTQDCLFVRYASKSESDEVVQAIFFDPVYIALNYIEFNEYNNSGLKYKKIHDPNPYKSLSFNKNNAYLINYQNQLYYKDNNTDDIHFVDNAGGKTHIGSINRIKNHTKIYNAIKKINITNTDKLNAYNAIKQSFDNAQVDTHLTDITIEMLNTYYSDDGTIRTAFTTQSNSDIINELNTYNAIKRELDNAGFNRDITFDLLTHYSSPLNIKAFVYQTSHPKWEFDTNQLFIHENGILLRILTLYFVEFMLNEMSMVGENQVLRPFSTNKTNNIPYSFITSGIPYLNTLQITKQLKNNVSNTIPITISDLINTLYYSDNTSKYYYANNHEFKLTDNYQKIEIILEETISIFLSNPSIDKTFGKNDYAGLTSVYKHVIIELDKLTAIYANSNANSNILNAVVGIIKIPGINIKMYDFASDYLCSQFSSFLHKNADVSVKVKHYFKFMEYGILLMIISKIVMSCANLIISGSTHNYFSMINASCAGPSGILLSLYSILKAKTIISRINENAIDILDTAAKDKPIDEIINELEQVSDKAAPRLAVIKQTNSQFFKSVKDLIDKRVTYDNLVDSANSINISKLVINKTEHSHEESIISFESITFFLMKNFFGTNDIPQIHIILSAFSYAFVDALIPLRSKRPLYIMYKELCTYKTSLK